MKKNRGFTLIELLAVIVILAIIALIATPLIMRVIEEARKNSAKDSAYGYIDAIELSVALSLMDNNEVDFDGQYTISGNKLVNGDSELIVNHKGNEISGIVLLEKGRVVSAELKIGG